MTPPPLVPSVLLHALNVLYLLPIAQLATMIQPFSTMPAIILALLLTLLPMGHARSVNLSAHPVLIQLLISVSLVSQLSSTTIH